MVGDVNPRKDIAGLVASYISKWNPYGLESVMKTYFEKINDPEIIDFVIKVYCWRYIPIAFIISFYKISEK